MVIKLQIVALGLSMVLTSTLANERLDEVNKIVYTPLVDRVIRLERIFGEPRDPHLEECCHLQHFKSCMISTNVLGLCLTKEQAQLVQCRVYSHLREMVGEGCGGHLEAMRNENVVRFISKRSECDVPRDVQYDGHMLSEYDLTMIHFEYECPSCKTKTPATVCKFHYGREFIFALYCNLSRKTVSHEFRLSCGCIANYETMHLYPMLDSAELEIQCPEITEAKRVYEFKDDIEVEVSGI